MDTNKQQELRLLEAKLSSARQLGWLCLALMLLPVLVAMVVTAGSLNATGHDAGFGLVVLLMAAVPMMVWSGLAFAGYLAAQRWKHRLEQQCAELRSLAVNSKPGNPIT